MSDAASHRSTWREAVEILVARQVANAEPRDPGAYAGSVRSRLLNDTRTHARALLEAQPDLTAAELAELLDDTPAVAPRPEPAFTHRAPALQHFDRRQACATCGCHGGLGWMPAPDRDELGMTPDLAPCPTCAVDRVRDEHHLVDRESRERIHEAHARGVRTHRAKHGTDIEHEESEAA